MKFFKTFKCSGQILSNSLCQFWNDNSIPLQILYLSSVSWKVIALWFFSSKNIHFARKEPIKMKFFETFGVLGSNFVKFLMSILKQQVDSSPNFVSLIHLYFFSSNNIYIPQLEPIKTKFFETNECSGQILSYSLCQFWNNKSIPLQILHPSSVSWKITPLYFFSSKNI